MANPDNYRQQAQYWSNYHLIDRSVKACVHVEDKNDVDFWDCLLQKHNPGNYHFIAYSYSNKNKRTTGCEQCLRFAPYLSAHFFVCIDSDYRDLLGQSGLDAHHYIMQTYTYSWENHFCQVANLQDCIGKLISPDVFNFSEFLNNYSKAVYIPLLILLHSRERNDGELRDKEFNQCLINQCTGKDIADNGKGIIGKIITGFAQLIESHRSYIDELDINRQKSKYAKLGLTASTAYLHIRGHNLLSLIEYICKLISPGFPKAALTSTTPSNNYREIDSLVADIKSL